MRRGRGGGLPPISETPLCISLNTAGDAPLSSQTIADIGLLHRPPWAGCPERQQDRILTYHGRPVWRNISTVHSA
ncbi:MAG: hypothetical protein N2110_07420 [Flavobacteriales bacterium]|nr:hypothetical protein [Flavobacteriales bacterium]